MYVDQIPLSVAFATVNGIWRQASIGTAGFEPATSCTPSTVTISAFAPNPVHYAVLIAFGLRDVQLHRDPGNRPSPIRMGKMAKDALCLFINFDKVKSGELRVVCGEFD